jgi:hypothetical protein
VTYAAENNLIKNSNLKLDIKTGYPKYWRPSKGAVGDRVEIAKDKFALRLTGAEAKKRTWWTQSLNTVKKEKAYMLNVRLKGASGVRVFAYVECNKPWQTFASSKIKCNGDWQEVSVKFNFKKLNRAPYLILCLIGKGEVLFADPQITAYTAPAVEQILKNPEFNATVANQLPANWYLSKGAVGRRVKASADAGSKYMLELNNSKNLKRSYWIQHSVNVKANNEYRLTVKFKGTSKAVFRVYLECNKPWHTVHSPNITCNGKWQEIDFKFKFLELGRLPYAVFRLNGTGKVVFTKPSIVKASEGQEYSFADNYSGWKFQNGNVIDLGGYHQKVIRLSTQGQKAYAVSKKLMLQSGQNYLLTYQVKGGNDLKYTDSQGATWFRIVPLSNNAIISGKGEWLDVFSSWQTKRVSFKVPAANKKIVPVNLQGELKGAGCVYFDNITVKKINADALGMKILFDFPFAYRNSCCKDKGLQELSGVILNNIPEVSKLEINFNGKTQVLPVVNVKTAFSLPLPQNAGVYPIKVKALKSDGNKAAAASINFTVRKPAPKQISFNKERIMLINGKPFFPLGVWTIHGPKSLNEKYKLIARNGFNIALCDADDLDIIASKGLMGMVRVIDRVPKFSNTAQYQKWLDFYTSGMREIMPHPALAGYFIIDEPAWRGVPAKPLIEAYNLVRSIDPIHPILLNEAPRGKIDSLREYASACDLYGVDIYPVPAPNSHSGMKDKMMTCVGRYTDKCRQVVWDRKPVWMTLQGCSWRAITRKPRPFRYPNHQENRFMAYNAIVHGSTGLFWWGINCGNENWEFVENLGRTIKELRALSPVLVSKTIAKSGLKSSCSELAILHKIHKDKNYYIVVNESGKKLNADLKGPGGYSLKVLFEKRRISRKNNTFYDSFEPYSVHVYTDADKLPEPLPSPLNFSKKVKIFKSTDDFNGADWIWYPGKNKTPHHHAYFIRKLNIDSKISQASLFMTADDRFKCYLNGELILEHNRNRRDFTTVSVLDITRKLKPGDNYLKIHAADGGQAPCALLYALRLTTGNGNVRQIISDDKTLSAEKVPANWLKDNFIPGNNWVKSQNIGKYGTQPWGFRSVAKPASNSLLGEFPL